MQIYAKNSCESIGLLSEMMEKTSESVGGGCKARVCEERAGMTGTFAFGGNFRADAWTQRTERANERCPSPNKTSPDACEKSVLAALLSEA